MEKYGLKNEDILAICETEDFWNTETVDEIPITSASTGGNSLPNNPNISSTSANDDIQKFRPAK